MTRRKTYQDIYPSEPLLNSATAARASAADLLTLEYFEAEPATMPIEVFDQHHILVNLNERSHRVENWRDGEHHDFVFEKDEIVVTPAGVESGWRWHATSRCIVITLEPDKFQRFAEREVGVLLAAEQLKDQPQFSDPDICQAASMLKEALTSELPGSAVMYESLARVFLVKLIHKYGVERDEEILFSRRFTAQHYRRVLDFIAECFAQVITVEDLAKEASLSPSHFAHVFKATIGVSPMQFVTSYRLEQARKRLADPELPIIDVALSCGFGDHAHFSRVFKQSEGLTPSQFRKQLTDPT